MTAMMVCKIAMVVVTIAMAIVIAIQSYVIYELWKELDRLDLEIFKLKYIKK